MIRKLSKIISRAAAAVCTLALALGCLPATAFADSSQTDISQPKLSVYAVYADRIAISTENYAEYPAGTKFDIYVSGRKLKTIKASSAKVINIYNGATWLKPSTAYTIKVAPSVGRVELPEASIKVRTASCTYYKIMSGAKLYKLSGGKMRGKKFIQSAEYTEGSLVTSSGVPIAGKPAATFKGKYIRICSGTNEGFYARSADCVRANSVTAQRKIVSAYGASMNGGAYVWGAEQFRRTDCSGLTMLCYQQIGRYMPHSVAYQSTLGKAVSVRSMQPGDLIIMNYRSHVGLYIGNGKMVHAMNQRDGIKVQPISYLQYYHVDTVRRIIQ